MDEINKLFNPISANPQLRIVLTVVLVLVVLVAVWMLLRNLRLWYWKTDKVIDTLNHLNKRMSEMEENIDKIKISTEILLNNDVRYLSAPKEVEALPEEAKALPEETKALPEETEASEDSSFNEHVSQLERVEHALKELQQQNEHLEADLNSRIRT